MDDLIESIVMIGQPTAVAPTGDETTAVVTIGDEATAVPTGDTLAAALGKLTEAALQGLLNAARAEANLFQYLQWRTVDDFGLIAIPAHLDPTTYEEAWAFGSRAELRWRRETWFDNGQPHNGWRVVFIGHAACCPAALVNSPTVINLSQAYQARHNAVVRLWGEQVFGKFTWLEQRIPRPLDYPWRQTAVNLGLVVSQYYRNGYVEFVQHRGLVRWP